MPSRWNWPPADGASIIAALMKIVVNGLPRDVRDGSSVADLVRDSGLEGKPIAVEINRRVIPRREHGGTRLAEGDRIEVVHFVGGG